MPKSFPPVIDETSETLILGSMPGVKSLEKQQYYAHPRNHFWPLLYSIFDTVPIPDYDDRLQWLLTRRLALWDVLAYCQRQGSLDQSIREERPNDLRLLLQRHPRVRRVLFNGTKAFSSFRKHIGFSPVPGVEFRQLPSTSPIPGRHIKTFSEKLILWRTELLQQK